VLKRSPSPANPPVVSVWDRCPAFLQHRQTLFTSMDRRLYLDAFSVEVVIKLLIATQWPMSRSFDRYAACASGESLVGLTRWNGPAMTTGFDMG